MVKAFRSKNTFFIILGLISLSPVWGAGTVVINYNGEFKLPELRAVPFDFESFFDLLEEKKYEEAIHWLDQTVEDGVLDKTDAERFLISLKTQMQRRYGGYPPTKRFLEMAIILIEHLSFPPELARELLTE